VRSLPVPHDARTLMRLRIRINDDTGERLAALRPTLRGMVAAMVLEAHALGINLGELLAARRELAHLGTLINQSLRVSRGLLADPVAVEEAAQIIGALIRK